MNEKQSVADHQMPEAESWVDLYGDYLYRYALSRIRDSVIAEDLVQETFLSALQAREDFRGDSSMRTWLTGILKHKIIDHFRKSSREKTVNNIEPLAESIDSLFDEKGQWRVRPNNWAVNPSELFEQKEFWKVFERCLSELPARQAQTLTLREMDGLSSEEICKVLNVSASNCWVMLYRARMYMRRCLEINWFSI